MRLLIKDITVIPMTGPEEIIKNGAIAVEDGRIVYVGPAEEAPSDFRPNRVLRGSNFVALPGLVNAHTHAAMTLFRGYADDLPLKRWLEEAIWPLEAKLKGEDVYWGTLLACAEMLLGGTTTFADMYFFMDEVAEAVDKSGIRASLARGLIGILPGADKALKESEEFVRRWHGKANGRITCMLGPHAPYTCPPAYLEEVVRLAEELQVGIHIHVSETAHEVEEIRRQYGCSPVEMLEKAGVFRVPVLAAHGVHLSPRDMEILAQYKAAVVHNPESNMKLASGIAPVTELLAAGVTVALGTDGAASNNNLDMWEEMRAAALLAKVSRNDPEALPAYQALEMATLGGAKALGLADQIGTLEVGKRADIVLVDLARAHLQPPHDPISHLVYAARASDVDTVIVDGRIVVEGGRLITLDLGEIMARSCSAARRLVGKPLHRSLL
ncbi:amidohydrolase [Ammonifex degensii KC4]|uniref:5-methylthioadenosine/S-adenosylhomocysteine deaminase n=1 Tax=Ammonifex degensii (strain DSM 10501 / KC4) TaxID=429009 RepID=C9RCX5_AMMDK|nr:amidohydrolase [Ammonifex degensii]ACX52102.1 amidohydrolase [Ammonifex degensii KC4]